MESIYIKTLGCKVNTYDSFDLASQFEKLGYKITADQKEANISIVNTCTVTENANKEARYLFRKFKRNNPESLVVATGCYAQTSAKSLESIGEVDYIFPNEGKEKLAKNLHGLLNDMPSSISAQNKIITDNQKTLKGQLEHFKTSLNLTPVENSRTRAFLKIQDGCDSFCTYCIIPLARGKSRSAPMDNVIGEVKRLITDGYKEIVFTGIHIGDYGDDFAVGHSYGKKPFVYLLQKLLEIENVPRIRISSLEPKEVSPELIKVLATRPEVVCDHFHLPLQSGSDRILKLMNRSYDSNEYRDTVSQFREYFPNSNIGADIIPGFPSETELDHRESLSFIESVGLNYLHVFPYSKRPKTAASRMPGHLSVEEINCKRDELISLSKKLKTSYLENSFESEVNVLFQDKKDRSGRPIGISPNYLNVALSGSQVASVGEIKKVKIVGKLSDELLLGSELS